MYGSSIDSIEFYLTNENNDPIDLQVSQFSMGFRACRIPTDPEFRILHACSSEIRFPGH